MNYDVVVAGAGIFGASTALALQSAGLRVLLRDAWGVGNPRATSADASRIVRAAYGARALYSRWSAESLAIWKQWQREAGVPMYVRTGVLWLSGEDAAFTAASLACLHDLDIPVEEWPTGEASARFPQFAGITDRSAIYEPDGGVLLARQALLAVVEMFERRGGAVEVGVVDPRIQEGTIVYACGPWLPSLFPDLLRHKMHVTRQEVFYFAAMPHSPDIAQDFAPGRFPTWLDVGSSAGRGFSWYGTPNIGPGVKLASDLRGEEFDPTSGDRTVSAASVAVAREYLSVRFPALAAAPLVEARVCQYEQTLDSHLIIDRHPEWDNIWIVGGGSGHGFKLAPAVGRCAARCVQENSAAHVPAELRF